MSDHARRAVPALLVACGFLAGGCRTGEPIFPPLAAPIVWPAAGDPPRLAYRGVIEGEASLKRPRSIWHWLGEAVGGRQPPAAIRSAHGVAVLGPILYVSDPDLHLVHRFDLEARRYRALTDAGGGRRFVLPIGLAVQGEKVLVTDRALRSVTVLTAAGAPEAVLGEGMLEAPVGIASGPVTGRVYVADVSAHQIRVLDPSGSLVRSIGSRGSEPGEFNFPTFVAADAAETIYVSDSLNFRIQAFDTEGRFLRAWGKKGSSPGEFSQPKGLACDREGRVQVVDANFENVQVFTPQGELLLSYGEEGKGPGQFWLPVGIFIDRTDTIWVGDSFNHRVQVFHYLGGGDQQP